MILSIFAGIESILNVIRNFDSFKKIVLGLLTGIAFLILLFGWKVVNEIQISDFWNNRPKIIRSEVPCSLIQVRNQSYIMLIPFDTPTEQFEELNTFFTGYTLDREPNKQEYRRLCNSLIYNIFSDQAERVLEPYKYRVQREPRETEKEF